MSTLTTESLSSSISSITTKMNEYIFTFLTTVSVIGTIGNSIVAFVYWRKKDKQTSTFFILILAFSDLTVCSVLIPITIYMEKINFETENIYFCKTFFFLTTTTVPASSLLMTAIAFDRYFCICMVSRNIMTLSRAKLLVLILLIISGLLGVIPALGTVITEQHQSYASVNASDLIYSCMVDTSQNNTFGFLIMPFKRFYDLIYAGSVLTITVLYIFIYKEIYTRRKTKRIRKRELFYNSMINGRGGVSGPNRPDEGVNETTNINNNNYALIKYRACNKKSFNQTEKANNNLYKKCCFFHWLFYFNKTTALEAYQLKNPNGMLFILKSR
jgi:hypothetical protein